MEKYRRVEQPQQRKGNSMVLRKALRSSAQAGAEAIWHFWLGMGFIVTGVLVGLLGMVFRMNLLLFGLASLIVIAGMVQLSFWSRMRQCWL